MIIIYHNLLLSKVVKNMNNELKNKNNKSNYTLGNDTTPKALLRR